MPRNISFAMTPKQIADKTKTVTRRVGWAKLKPGDELRPVLKSMGLKFGEKAERIGGLIRVVSVRSEPLNAITKEECILEGFPEYEPEDFISLLCKQYNCPPETEMTRIEFEYL